MYQDYLVNEVVLNQLNCEGRLADTTTSNNNNLVLSHFEKKRSTRR